MEVEQDNKMTSGNLGIVFGPTLMRPRPTDATISLSSLVDYPHQARIIEALIIFYPTIFEHKDVAPAEPGRRGSGATEEVASGAERVGISREGGTLRGCSMNLVWSPLPGNENSPLCPHHRPCSLPGPHRLPARGSSWHQPLPGAAFGEEEFGFQR